ncbi:MAG: HEAT repeat domain-containing protein [Halobacterium sp.]
MDLDSDGHGVDPDQVAALRDAVDVDAVDALVDRLDSDDPDVRAGAAWRLVEAASSNPTKVRTHLDSVLEGVRDDDVWVRRGATWVLAELAERQPDALSVKFADLVDLTRAEDPLVRQNGVVAVAGVTKAYPARATQGLSSIVPLTQSSDPLLQRYARKAVREVAKAIAERADDAGYPMLVRSFPEYADLFPEGVSVVTVNEDDERSRPVYVSFGRNAPVRETREEENEEPSDRVPAEFPDPPPVVLEEDDLSPNLRLRSDVITTDYRANVDENKLEHGLATLRRLDVADHQVRDAFADAVREWVAIDEHDHVESVLGHGEGWLATRYDDAATLDRRGTPETLSEAVWDVACVTRAVSYAHARGVVHGGLHPGAVRFLETGQREWDAPVVADWGFAHAASGVETPPIPAGFAAPEHRDPGTYGRFDQSTDVFGLGALAYFLLTGEPPVTGDGVVPASEYNPALGDDVASLFDRSLADEKAARFDTVLDFQRAFDGVAAAVAEGVA